MRNMLKLKKFKSVATSLEKLVIFITVMRIKLRAGKNIKEKPFVLYSAAFKLCYTISDKDILKNV
jgi:hypothetical protein